MKEHMLSNNLRSICSVRKKFSKFRCLWKFSYVF